MSVGPTQKKPSSSPPQPVAAGNTSSTNPAAKPAAPKTVVQQAQDLFTQAKAAYQNATTTTVKTQSGSTTNTSTFSVRPDGAFIQNKTNIDDKVKVDSSASVKVGPNSVSANASAGGKVELPGGASIGFSTSVNVSADKAVESKDGFTTATLTGKVQVSASVSADVGVVGAELSKAEGNTTTYKVRMSDADFAKVQSGQAPKPDPFNPTSMPVGSSIKLESRDFQDTGFAASYRQIKLDTNIREEQAASTLVEKTGPNTVRVTVGPSEAIENSWKLGVSIGPANISVGRTDRVENFQLKTAEFDLSTTAGKAAYNTFMTTGKIPTQNGNGITNAASIEKLQADSTSTVGGGLGPISASLSASIKTDVTVTTFADGSKKSVTDIKNDYGIPMQINRAFGPDGKEDLSQQKYTLKMDNVTPTTAALLIQAYTGDEAKAKAASDQISNGKPMSFTLELTRDQAQKLQEGLKKLTYTRDPGWQPQAYPNSQAQDKFMNTPDPMAAVLELRHGHTDTQWLAENLQDISFWKVAGDTMPGTLTYQ